MTDVVPFVERHFRVAPRPESRAIAGLSMGGGQTQRVLGSHPGAFAYVAVWSAGVNPAATADFEKRNAAMLGDAAKVKDRVAEWEAAGVTTVLLALTDPAEVRQVAELLA